MVDGPADTAARRSTPRRSSARPGDSACTTVLSSRRNAMASRFSRPPQLVGHPLPALAGVVEVEHRGDGVDPQAVDVELLEPVQGVGDEEVADLVAAVVEHERPPVGVLALARVGVLVERGAVEAGQRPRRPSGSGPAPSRRSRRCRAGGGGRRSSGSRPGRRSATSARSSRSPGSPTSRRRGARRRACSSTWVKPSAVAWSASSGASSR